MRRSRGFTIIEFVLVMAVFVLLVALLMPQYMKIFEDSGLNTAVSESNNLITNIESYYLENEVLPSGLSELEAYMEDSVKGKIVKLYRTTDRATGLYTIHMEYQTSNGYTVYYPASEAVRKDGDVLRENFVISKKIDN